MPGAAQPPQTPHSGTGARAMASKSAQAQPLPTRTTGCYFHSQSVERLFPSASTSYSKIAATVFSRDHLGDELW